MRKFIPLAFLSLALLSAAAPLRAEDEGAKPKDRERHSWHWGDGDFHCRHWKSTFAWQAQVDLPTQDLGRALDHRTGLGLGVQWNHDHENGHVSRTRLEWNTFPEGKAVGAGEVKTKASNYVLSFDRLYHFQGEMKGAYVLGGLGAVRWFLDRTPAALPAQSSHTTKLAVSAGAGYRFNRSFSLEARYLLSSLDKSFDGSTVQAGLNMRF